MNNFRGDLTDISAKKEALLQSTAHIQIRVCVVHNHGSECTQDADQWFLFRN